MSDYVQKDGQGALFTNNKDGNEKAPDWTGSATINGTKFSVSAWENEGRKGPYLSLRIQEWQDRPPRSERSSGERREERSGSGRPAKTASQQPPASSYDDDIPF